MKRNVQKTCILLLALLMLPSLFTGCFYVQGKSPAQTTDAGKATTAAPEGNILPLPTLNVRDIEKPYLDAETYGTWLAGLQLPEVLPTAELEYEEVLSICDSNLFYENAIISNLEELYAFAYYNKAFDETENALWYKDYKTVYDTLKTVDFSQKSAVLVSYTDSETYNVNLDKVLVHNNNLIAAFSSPLGTDDLTLSAFCTHTFVLLVDKADLPASEDGLTILSYIAFPNQDRAGYPNVQFDGQTVFEEKE